MRFRVPDSQRRKRKSKTEKPASSIPSKKTFVRASLPKRAPLPRPAALEQAIDRVLARREPGFFPALEQIVEQNRVHLTQPVRYMLSVVYRRLQAHPKFDSIYPRFRHLQRKMLDINLKRNEAQKEGDERTVQIMSVRLHQIRNELDSFLQESGL